MIRRPPRSTRVRSSAASDVYKRQGFVPLVSEMLKGSGIPTCSVVGFPLGATTSKAKAFETKEAIENGAGEIDMVINIIALKSRDYNRVRSDIAEVVILTETRAKVI